MIIYLERLLPAASSDPPGNESGQLICSLFGLASDGVYMATVVTNSTVVSYTAFPPLPLTWRYISVALSLESPPPDVIRHPALRSPDFPHLPYGSRDHLSYFYIKFYTSKQLPPTNSLQMELFGNLSLLTPKKYSKNLSNLLASKYSASVGSILYKRGSAYTFKTASS